LEQQWPISKHAQKREILKLVCLNFRLDGVSLVAEMNKPFDMLVEGLLIPSSRGDKI
jgi:site-specific DNA recombinase